MERVMSLWVRRIAVLACMLTVGAASADHLPYCRAANSGDSPMVFGSEFGVASCNMRRAPRYHIDDYADAGRSGGASSTDPMVWDRNQWGSDLFGYSRSGDDGYDRRFHEQRGGYARVVRRAIEIDVEAGDRASSKHVFKTGVIDGQHVEWTIHRTIPRAAESSLKGARVISGGAVCEDCGLRTAIKPVTRCPTGGALTITWSDGAAQYRCTTPRSFHRWIR
jgi:hypothetical protein